MVDVENTIFRQATDSDKPFFEVDLNKPKYKKSARERFEEELGKKELDAVKSALPFAKQAARNDFEATVQSQIQEQLRLYGRIEYPEQIKVPTIDWNKYSDLKNFEIIEEGEVNDSNLTKNNPGLNVTVKKVTYQYKGYGNKYTVMESASEAIKRAQEKSWKARKEFDKKN